MHFYTYTYFLIIILCSWSLYSIASARLHRSDYNIGQTDQTMNIVADRRRLDWYNIMYFIHNHTKIIIILYLYNAPRPLHPPLQSQRCTVRSIFFYIIIRIYRYLYSIIRILYTICIKCIRVGRFWPKRKKKRG